MTINILTLIQCHVFFKPILLNNDSNAVWHFSGLYWRTDQ